MEANNLALTEAVAHWRRALAEAGFGNRLHPFHCSQLLNPKGDRAAAESACRALLAELPDHGDALEGLAFLLQLQGRNAEVTRYRQRLLRLRVRDLGVDLRHEDEAVGYLLAAEGRSTPPACSPRAYVRALFDRYAENFDAHLQDKLCYRGPRLLYQALGAVSDLRSLRLDVLDVGCGTGLAGVVFQGLARRLDGLDLSPAMLEKAAARGIYNRLQQGDIVQQLPRLAKAYDLVVAADVLVYFGDLVELFSGVHGVLRRGGYFVFSVERGESQGFRLRSSGRYQHHPAYVRQQAEDQKFALLYGEPATLRQQDGRPVTAVVFVLQRRPSAD